jgi:hypothetical protein
VRTTSYMPSSNLAIVSASNKTRGSLQIRHHYVCREHRKPLSRYLRFRRGKHLGFRQFESTFSRWLSQEGVVCRIGLRAKLARFQAFAFQNAPACVQPQH